MRHIRVVALLAVVGIVSSLLLPLSSAQAAYGQVSTWFGKVYAGDGGNANSAFLDTPLGFTADAQCNLYVADTQDYVVRKIDHTDNTISTVMGNGTYGNLVVPSAPKSSQLKMPVGIVQSAAGNFFITDRDEGTIRLLNSDQTYNRTLVKGLNQPNGLAVDTVNLYVAETGRNRILAIPLSTLESGGPILTVGSSSSYSIESIVKPYSLAVDGTVLYVTANNTSVLYRFDQDNLSLTTLKTGLQGAEGVTVYNHDVYFVTSTNGTTNQINKYHPTDGVFTVLQNVAEDEWYNHNTALLFCGGSMYILMSNGSSIYKANADGSNPVKIAGAHRWGDQDGSAATALLGRPKAMVRYGNYMYLLENHRFEKINLVSKSISFIAGYPNDNFADGVGNLARVSGPTAMTISPDGKNIYFADKNNNRIRKLNIATKTISTISGAGMVNMFNNQVNGYSEGNPCTTTMTAGAAGCAYFTRPTGIAISKFGTTLYVADSGNNRIRAVNITTGVTTLIAGGSAGYKNGTGANAKFNSPQSLLLSPDNNTLYVVDVGNNVVRAINLKTKAVTTLAGVGRGGYRDGAFNASVFSVPDSLAWGPDSSTIFLSEVGTQRIRVLNLKTKTVGTLAGTNHRGTRDGARTVASFNNPRGMLQLNASTLLVADSNNDLIRAVSTK